MTEPLTPVQVEDKLRALVNQISLAQADLRIFRIKESEAFAELLRAKVKARSDPACPEVKRGETTVAKREEWIEERVLDFELEYQNAVALREIAQDALRARIAESQAVQSLNASVRQAYQMAGHG